MMVWLASLLLICGAVFAFVAALGVVRMPDLYCRMHAATKAGAFGVTLMLLALCLAMPSLRVFIQSFLVIAFFYLTAPVAAHMLSRVAIIRKLPIWRYDKADQAKE